MNPVNFGSSFSQVAKQVLQNSNFGSSLDNLSNRKIEGNNDVVLNGLNQNLHAAALISNSVMKRRAQ